MSRIGVGGKPGTIGVRAGGESRPSVAAGTGAPHRVADASHFEVPRGARGPTLVPPSSHVGYAKGVVEPEALSQFTDHVSRNHAITQGYQALSEGMSSVLGERAASWVAFGAWGSAQVGQELRREDAPGGLQDALEQVQAPLRALSGVDDLLVSAGLPALADRVQRLEGESVRAGFERALADGNCAIYSTLAGPFSRFLGAAKDGSDESLSQAVSSISDDDGMLREALGNYAASLRSEPALRDGLLLLANDQVGLTAQAQLSEPIDRLLSAPIEEGVRETLSAALTSIGSEGPEAAERLSRVREGGGLDRALDEAARVYGRLFREAATGLVLRQAIPHETLGRAEAQTRASLSSLPGEPGPQARFDALVSTVTAGPRSERGGAPTPDAVLGHMVRRQQDVSWLEAPQSVGTAAHLAEPRETDDWR